MAVVSIDQAYAEEARWEQTSREWREFWKVGMSQLSDGPAAIATGLPKFLPSQPHPDDPQALVVEWWPRRIDATNFWDLELRYSTDVDFAGSPLAVPAVVTIDNNLRELPALQDVNGNPIVNAAGQFLTDPPATFRVVDQVITITKNLSLNLPPWVQSLNGVVNSDNVTIRGLTYPAGTLFSNGAKVGAENNLPGQEGNFSTLRTVPYTEASIELWYHPDGWTGIYPNVGYYQVVPLKPAVQEKQGQTSKQIKQQLRLQRNLFQQYGQYTLAPIIIGYDAPPHPWPLDANGRAIQQPTPQNIVFLEYDTNPKQAFGSLPGVNGNN